MARVAGHIYIECPPEVVFDCVADERNEPRYNPKMTAVSLVSEPPIGQGSRFAANVEVRGAHVHDDDRVHRLPAPDEARLGVDGWRDADRRCGYFRAAGRGNPDELGMGSRTGRRDETRHTGSCLDGSSSGEGNLDPTEGDPRSFGSHHGGSDRLAQIRRSASRCRARPAAERRLRTLGPADCRRSMRWRPAMFGVLVGHFAVSGVRL